MAEITQDTLPATPPYAVSGEFDVAANIVVHLGDTLEFLKKIPPETAKLIISSPPYNIGKSYEDRQSFDQYIDFQSRVADELVRILHPLGSLCWQVGNYIEKKEVYPLDIQFYPIFKERGLRLRNRIIWHMGHGMHERRRFSGRYETILWFTKGDDYTFNLDAVREPNNYPGKRHYKGKNRGKPSCNPLGKNPSDYWEIVVRDWEQEIWEMPNVKSSHVEKTIHPCQYPVELVERCVFALTNERDWVLDPFCGVGSSLLAGLMHNRKVIGVDKEPAYIDITQQRIDQLYKGQLRVRELGTQIMVPNGREKWSRIPEEWLDDPRYKGQR
jgi:adenine-specific DNA-methyltransferase